jgi:hypothetical protein
MVSKNLRKCNADLEMIPAGKMKNDDLRLTN